MGQSAIKLGAFLCAFIASTAVAQTGPLATIAAKAECPRERTPDIQPEAFSKLPAELQDWVAKQDERFKNEFVCGRYLNDLLTGKYGVVAKRDGSANVRNMGLSDMQTLIAAGQVPRDYDGTSNWAGAAKGLLDQNREPDRRLRVVPPRAQRRLEGRQGRTLSDAELHEAFFQLFEKQLAPRIELATEQDRRNFADLLQEIATLPKGQALPVLQSFDKRGLLKTLFVSRPDELDHASRVLERTMQPSVAEEIFDFFNARVPRNDEMEQKLITTAVRSWNPTALARCIKRGFAPITEELFALANQEQIPEIHAQLAAEATKRGARTIPPYRSQEFLKPGVESSYRCYRDRGSVQRVQDEGSHGCYFILRDPETGKPMPNTRYRLVADTRRANGWADRQAVSNDFTDAQGRTPYILSEPDIEIRAKMFVALIGDGEHEMGFELHSEPDAEGNVPTLARRYEILGCNGKPAYRGRADAHGQTVIYLSRQRCEPKIRLLPFDMPKK